MLQRIEQLMKLQIECCNPPNVLGPAHISIQICVEQQILDMVHIMHPSAWNILRSPIEFSDLLDNSLKSWPKFGLQLKKSRRKSDTSRSPPTFYQVVSFEAISPRPIIETGKIRTKGVRSGRGGAYPKGTTFVKKICHPSEKKPAYAGDQNQ